ncbi:valine--tRNA ligase [Symbiobacterium thermophilum]|uniref:Valine--tRNA ligase n=1 Tax=Symbiobacterium thermophilum (strain DSM 24528 / JCM 14929 / IAM 14863 / T) TaxID=292459 RepID=SYV_SYMTH|nr:valine--tRNA ligase [Symbiobacterium thermophilum]Q67SJ2.1 RecName: Full=Valine--tRNA ligase; AltName: Full=Valyl-tRNA synthetase; Short=ValRS [Symbiobacterium thermophilum IAM 14863]BAD39351.1 valyl-tRNA synthetase [Symbiobacterium thermophilum IAM 14863]
MSAEQKQGGTELAPRYDAKLVEDEYYQYWMDGGFYRAPIVEGKQPYTIVIPPPNVTGTLHLGHALNNTMIDILIRWKRMQGHPTLYLPGTDHAGLATQIRVEEDLRKSGGPTRHELGREAFVAKVWDWKERYHATITSQLRKLGVSVDWSREAFTMDERLSRAVRAFFVQLYKKGLIYQGTRITHWCPKDQTALSDIEVEYEERQGHMWHFRYPLADGSGSIVIATTRPETMLGDTAVAVNPEDERYKHLVGKMLRHPATGREIPIIADEYVDPAFGTGCVKITPFHDPNDFEIGLRHGLEMPQVIGPKGEMTEAAGKYAGLDRYECRRRIVADAEAEGWLVKVEEHQHAVGCCARCGTVIEPLISRQWYVKMKPLAEPAIRAVESGQIKIVPERFTKVYLHWMENIQDWCISRQIWWGHRIPVWYCDDCGHLTVSETDPTRCEKCGSANIRQDEDALDTWFSSALWPFSTLGWPDDTADLRYFFPTDVLVTGYDILFFWVARMIFSSLELTGKIPFHTVVLHGLVRDAQGRKMSKSLGNGVDPIDVIDQYGTDALRFMLVTGSSPGNDIRFHTERVENARNFANKLWNASRFVLMNLADWQPAAEGAALQYDVADRWIRHRFNEAARAVNELLGEYQYGEAARTIYDFIWSEFCDWYIELVKPRLYNPADPTRAAAQETLARVLEGTLRLLHPFMPYITEAIWQKLPLRSPQVETAPEIARAAGRDALPPSISVTAYPTPVEGWADAEANERMALIIDTIRALRSIRAEFRLGEHTRIDAVVMATSDQALAILNEGRAFIENLGKTGQLTIQPVAEAKPKNAAAAVVTGAEIYVPLGGLIDLPKEIERLTKELTTTGDELAKLEKKLSNEGFLTKAKPEVVEKTREEAAALAEKRQALENRLAMLRSMQG